MFDFEGTVMGSVYKGFETLPLRGVIALGKLNGLILK
jgi:hypothetical protein